MAIVSSNSFKIQALNASTGTKVDIAHSQSASLSFSNSLIDTTTKSSDAWSSKMSGQRSFTLSSDGLSDYETTASATNVITLASWAGVAGEMAMAQQVYFEIGIGSKTYDGSGWISSLEQSGGTDDAPTYSISIESNGSLTYTA